MVGQNKLQSKISELIEAGMYPRFSIFVGDTGSGKRTFIRQMLDKLGVQQMCETGIDSIRQVIESAYAQVSPTVYVFANADTMSIEAKNALLKVTEESPNNAYFVMTMENLENTLPTIRSRASVFYMDTYTPEEIADYYYRNYSGDNIGIVQTYCSVPGDVDSLVAEGVQAFHDLVCKVLSNVDTVTGANSFKIGTHIGMEKLALFWKAFRAECLANMPLNPLKYISGVNVTSKYLSELRIASANKQMTFDGWLLDIRKEWMQYD